MDQPPGIPPHREEVAVPPLVRVPVALALAALLLLCLAGSITMIVIPDKNAPILAPALGASMVLVSLWAFYVCYRMVIGKRVRGGLLGPVALRVAAWVFLSLPVAGLFAALLARDFSHPIQGLVLSAVYIGAFFRLRSLASHRERR